MHKKQSGKVKVGKPIVISPDVAASFDVPPCRSNAKMTWTPEQDMIILTRLRRGHHIDDNLPLGQFVKIFKANFRFGAHTTIRNRIVQLDDAGITAENYAKMMAAGKVPR